MSVDNVKEVRTRSGAPLGECASALNEAKGNVEEALVILQKRGIAKAVSKGGRVATEGRIHSYIHQGNRIAVIVEVNCETDFVARNTDFVEFCEAVAMQIAAMSPVAVERSAIYDGEIATQQNIFEEQVDAKKPEDVRQKIIAGKFDKWYSEVCLLEQESVLHPKQTIEDLRLALVAKLGENIKIRRFARMEVGEGLQKKSQDFSAEVEKLAQS